MEAMQQAGYSAEVQGKIAGKLTHWQMYPEKMAMSVGQYGKDSGYTDKEMADAAKQTAEEVAKSAESGAKTAEATKGTTDTLSSKHTAYFAFSPNFLRAGYAKVTEEAVEKGALTAVRQALYEYFLYSDLDKESVIKTMTEGKMGIKDFTESLVENASKGIKPEDVFKTLGGGEDAPKPEGKQHGGVVSGIGSDGLALFRRPSGEGVTGIRPGERIVPAYAGSGGGGGGGEIRISLAADAQKLIQVEVQRGILEHDRRRRTAG
jgi:hypothetical protein